MKTIKMTNVVKLCVLQIAFLTIESAAEIHHDGKSSYNKRATPYSFSYGVNDDYTGSYFSQKEHSNGKEVIGSYTVQLPDGRKQIVTYTADHEKGFQAEITYEGVAHYPPPSKYAPFWVKPTHHQPTNDFTDLREGEMFQERQNHIMPSD